MRLLPILLALLSATAWAEPRQLLIAPQAVDERLSADEAAHLVRYDSEQREAALLVWLPGTGGLPANGPRAFFDTALRQGYRVLGLSYRNTPAVSQVCVGARLRAQPDCAERFRQQRSWGEPASGLIDDRPEDGIVPRLTALLQHLVRADAAGQWSQYLDEQGRPRWSRIWLAGQSQGGGMAAFIAQRQEVGGVIAFSGGWDRGANGDIAAWYGRPSATPAARWHASFHVEEAQAALMARAYERLGIPAAQIHALAEPVQGGGAHGQGIANPAYRPLWERMLAPR